MLSRDSKYRAIIILMLVSALLALPACNRKDNGVSPVAQSPGLDGIPPTGGVHVSSFMVDGLPASYTKYLTIEPGFQSKIRANVYPDPKGENLALQGRGQIWIPSPIYIGGYSGYGWRPPIWEIDTTPFLGYDIRNLVDGDPATGIWLSGSQQQWPLQIASTWETPQIISRVYVVTQQVQGFQLCTDDNFDNFHPAPLNGSIIDINLDPPVVTRQMGLFLSGSYCGIMEYGLYGPGSSHLKITSPASNSLFMVGENIQFTSSASGNLINYQWFSDGVVFGTSPGSPNNAASYLSPGNHTIRVRAQKTSDLSEVSDSIDIEVLAGFKIVVLGSSGSNASVRGNLSPTTMITKNGIQSNVKSNVQASNEEIAVSYRAAKTKFQAIGYRVDGNEVGLVSVDWEIQGGEVVASEQLRMGVLSHLGQVNTRIGNIENSPIPVPGGSIFPILNSSQVTFHSFLPGNITLAAKKGTASDSVTIRIKKPVFKVNVYPVGDVETSIFATWENITRQVWEKEGIIKIESVTMQSLIPNVIYPNSPLTPPMQGGESVLRKRWGNRHPNLLQPLVFDCLLGVTNGFFNVPRQSGILLSSREDRSVNVYLVTQPWSYYVSNPFSSPPAKRLSMRQIYPISSRDHFVTLEQSGVIIRESVDQPPSEEYTRFLAAGIGRVFGLPQPAEWLQNFMDFSPIGGMEVTPLQFIASLNYNNDNPQNSTMIWEE